MADTLQVRFRPVAGPDLGPFSFPDTTLVQAIKDKLFAEWPKEGPLAKDPPLQVPDIKLILSGKFLDAAKTLKEYRKEMGDLSADAATVITMHVVVRPSAPPATKKQQGTTPGQAKEEEQSSGCGCIIS